MTSTDGGSQTRFQVCQEFILDIFQNNVRAHDSAGLYTFETSICEGFPLSQKDGSDSLLIDKIKSLPEPYGLTMFYDAVLLCMEKLSQSRSDCKILFALTDGDDNMSRGQPSSQKVIERLQEGIPGFNLVVVTCGSDITSRTMDHIKCWTESVNKAGGVGMNLHVDQPEFLALAFKMIADII